MKKRIFSLLLATVLVLSLVTPGAFADARYFSDVDPNAWYADSVLWAANKGIVVRFNKKQLPCFCQWKHTTGYNEGYVTGMEPAVNYPNIKSFERERGRVLTLKPQQTYTIDLSLEVEATAKGVAAVEKEVAQILGKHKTIVHLKPISKWSPGC